ncbi:MAG: T9SS type A sorting domain-containing protein [Ignavibacteria bacterium]|nr:T9SS type A sorting domain-containing protein [Ignavibacteria bacterium]
MRTIKVIVLIIIFTGISCSQWIQQTSGTTQNLTDIVVFPSSQTGIVVGYTSLVLKTTNNGTNWVSVTNPGNQYLYEVCYAGGTTAYSSGYTKIIKTTNSGTNWTATGPVPAKIYSGIFFLNENTGWSCGYCDTILKTTNGGDNWIIFGNSLFTTESNTDIQFVNSLLGFVTGFNSTGGHILRTVNGGANWVTVLTAQSNSLLCINMLDASTGYAGGHQTILKTTNGGTNWTFYNLPGTSSIEKITFPADQQTGYAVTESGRIYKTTNAGGNWYQLTTPTATPLYSIGFSPNSNTTGYAVGGNGVILRTTNGGGTFVGVNENPLTVPEGYRLELNYPNPFNPVTTINFGLPKSESVKLSVYDVRGVELEVLFNGFKEAGNHSAIFNAENYSSGIYFYKLTVGKFSETKKMTIIK